MQTLTPQEEGACVGTEMSGQQPLSSCRTSNLNPPSQTATRPRPPYLQLVEPGLTQLGEFEPVFIDRIGRLQLYRPPIENLVAAKLIRAAPKDLGDIQFLVSRHRPDLQRVRAIIAKFSPPARECATENLVYLDVLNP